MLSEVFLKSMSKEAMARIWDHYDWREAENELLSMQQELVKAVFAENEEGIVRLQKKIVRSDYAKMLAVKKGVFRFGDERNG